MPYACLFDVTHYHPGRTTVYAREPAVHRPDRQLLQSHRERTLGVFCITLILIASLVCQRKLR